jgi:agmatine/peptidylarginine deiminase
MEIKLPVTHLDEDYKSTGIILVYPDKLSYSTKRILKLKQFYKEYISLIPDDIEIVWIIRNKASRDEIKEIMGKKKYSFIHIYFVEDIWCGDWIPFIAVDKNENYLATQFIYPVSNSDDRAGEFIAKRFYEDPLLKIPLKLDAGCIEFNKGEFLLISKKIFEKNPDKTEEEITSILLKNYNVKQIYYFDYDSVLGHSDLLFRGIVKDKWVYSSFNGKTDPNVLNLIKQIQEDWPNCKWFEVPNEKLGIPEDDGSGDYTGEDDYTGNILDFMVMGHYVIFPIFSDSSKEAMKIIEKLMPIGVVIIPFESENLKSLYQLGGGLYCITTNF